jgi:hypothetical protein
MAVKVNLLRIGVVVLIVAALIASRAAAQENLVSLVQALQDAMSHGDLDAAMAMYADDAEFEFVGMGSLAGQEQIRGYKEYIAALNTDLQYSDCMAEGNTVTCKLIKNDDMLRKVTAGPVSHSIAFTFEGGLIQKQAVTTPPTSAKILGQTSGAFLGWVKENHSEAMAKLFTPEGQFVYSGEPDPGVGPGGPTDHRWECSDRAAVAVAWGWRVAAHRPGAEAQEGVQPRAIRENLEGRERGGL